MGLDGTGAEARLDFAVSDVNGQNVQTLLKELNETLIGILGHNGTAYVCIQVYTRAYLYRQSGGRIQHSEYHSPAYRQNIL